MPWKSAYEREAESLAAAERMRQARLDAIGKPPPNPHAYVDFYGRTETEAMTGQQTPPPYKDAYTREVERLAEMDARRLARWNGEPLPEDAPTESARILARRVFDPDRPQPKPQRDPRLGASAYVLANRSLGRPDNYGDDDGDDADG